jgi:hypothetical protein
MRQPSDDQRRTTGCRDPRSLHPPRIPPRCVVVVPRGPTTVPMRNTRKFQDHFSVRFTMSDPFVTKVRMVPIGV